VCLHFVFNCFKQVLTLNSSIFWQYLNYRKPKSNAIYALVAADRQGQANFEADLKAYFIVAHANDDSTSEIEEDDDEIFPANDMQGVAGSLTAPIVTPRAPNKHTQSVPRRPRDDDCSSDDSENNSKDDIE
jgi:hypothetical protein